MFDIRHKQLLGIRHNINIDQRRFIQSPTTSRHQTRQGASSSHEPANEIPWKDFRWNQGDHSPCGMENHENHLRRASKVGVFFNLAFQSSVSLWTQQICTVRPAACQFFTNLSKLSCRNKKSWCTNYCPKHSKTFWSQQCHHWPHEQITFYSTISLTLHYTKKNRC